MSALLGNITFLNPWLLLGLAGLPALWFLLRVMPPAARLVKFPAIRFLSGLAPDKQTPSHTPWWILLLRLLIAALVIIALANPVHNPATTMEGAGAIHIVIDNDWPAGATWDKQIESANDIAQRAQREKRNIYITATATLPEQNHPMSEGPMSGAQASALLKNLTPMPWMADYKAAAIAFADLDIDADLKFWIGHGTGTKTSKDISKSLGRYSYIGPSKENLPLLLKNLDLDGTDISIEVHAPRGADIKRPVTLHALNGDGQILDHQTITFDGGSYKETASFSLPEGLRSAVAEIRIAGQNSVGSVYVINANDRSKTVSIIAAGSDTKAKPFIEDIYYLERAIKPFSSVYIEGIDDALSRGSAVIILPDIAAMPAQTLSKLEQWVRDGGLLLRFAGPNMTTASSQSFLTPLPLRNALRSTQGSLSWENPPTLESFSKDSPFYGIVLSDEIKVRQQILPESGGEIADKIWARLNDGTPLITGDALGKGLLVMVHTTASAQWSDLALSGAYVEILQRILAMAGRTQSDIQSEGGVFSPLWVFNGFAQRGKPERWAEGIEARVFDETAAQPNHPPGLYMHAGLSRALNIGDHVASLQAFDSSSAAKVKTFDSDYEVNIMPYLLWAGVILLLIDWIIMIALSGGMRLFSRIAVLFILVLGIPHAVSADDLKYADGFYLAYIKTGDQTVDATTKRGLENLAKSLIRRTSAEPDGVAALDPERDTLSFFPLIYWPVSANQAELSAAALKNIQHYLDNGGTILFDTRTGARNPSPLINNSSQSLRRITQYLNIPPLAPISKKHVLSKSFYLLDRFPGRHDGGTLWVENDNNNGRDGVSSVIIGSHDWASAWASNNPRQLGGTGGSRQQELATRFGVNVVMYALTGNYKADQVHVPHILERLGE